MLSVVRHCSAAVRGMVLPFASILVALLVTSVAPLTTAQRFTHVLNAQPHPTNDEPFPSHDGSQVAIESNASGKQQIYIVSASDGTMVRRVTNDDGADDSPAWSHDGRTIVYVLDRGDRHAIYAIDANGEHPRGLTHDERLEYFHPMWSPDDRWLMYNRNAAPSSDIFELWAMHPDGSDAHAVTHNQFSETTYGS